MLGLMVLLLNLNGEGKVNQRFEKFLQPLIKLKGDHTFVEVKVLRNDNVFNSF